MKFHFAATLPINPPSVSPALTQEQVWKGLEFKARNPKGFVPVEESTIVEDHGEQGLTRRVKFILPPNGSFIPSEATEVVTFYPPTKVDFRMLEAQFNTHNIISVGSENELYLTYVFVVEISDSAEPEIKDQLSGMSVQARGAVKKSIDVIRQMVVEGKL